MCIFLNTSIQTNILNVDISFPKLRGIVIYFFPYFYIVMSRVFNHLGNLVLLWMRERMRKSIFNLLKFMQNIISYKYNLCCYFTSPSITCKFSSTYGVFQKNPVPPLFRTTEFQGVWFLNTEYFWKRPFH